MENVLYTVQELRVHGTVGDIKWTLKKELPFKLDHLLIWTELIPKSDIIRIQVLESLAKRLRKTKLFDDRITRKSTVQMLECNGHCFLAARYNGIPKLTSDPQSFLEFLESKFCQDIMEHVTSVWKVLSAFQYTVYVVPTGKIASDGMPEFIPLKDPGPEIQIR